MIPLLTPSDLVLLVLNGYSRPVNATEVAWRFRQFITPVKLGRVNKAATYLQDMVKLGIVEVGDKGFSISKQAQEELIPHITKRLSDEELERFSQ